MIFIALLLTLSFGTPQAGPARSQEDRLSKLSADLGSSEPSVRERAHADLVAMGRPALKTLRTLQAGATDPEIRLRAAAAAREIVDDLRRTALKMEVSTDKRTYQPGETVTVTVRLKNAEDFPVTVFLGDDDLDENAHSVILSGEKPVHIVIPTYQVFQMGPIPLNEKRFKTVPAGESVVVHTLNFRERWDLKGKNAGMKASYREAEKVWLEAGTYRAKAVFAWGFKSKKERQDAARPKDKELDPKNEDRLFVKDYTYTPKAKSLMAEAWEGELEGSVEFRVGRD